MKKFLWLLLLVLFAGFIFFNSSLPAETSYKASGLLAQWLDSLYAAIGDPMPVDRLEARLRKLAHFVEFAVLAMIMVNTFISWNGRWNRYWSSSNSCSLRKGNGNFNNRCCYKAIYF